MVVLWLLEFLIFATVLVVVIVFIQKALANNRARVRAQDFSQELMRFEEAKSIVLQHASREVKRGVPFEQAVLIVLSDGYWPDESDPSELTRES